MLQNCVKYYITHSDDPVNGLFFTLTPETLTGLLVTLQYVHQRILYVNKIDIDYSDVLNCII